MATYVAGASQPSNIRSEPLLHVAGGFLFLLGYRHVGEIRLESHFAQRSLMG